MRNRAQDTARGAAAPAGNGNGSGGLLAARGGRRRPTGDPAQVAQAPQEPQFARGQRLGELLIQAGAVTEAEVKDALSVQAATSRRLGEILIQSGATDERAVIAALGVQKGIQVVDLRHERMEPEARLRLPEAVARELRAVPLRDGPAGLQVAFGDVPDAATRQRLAEAAGKPVSFVLAPPGEVQHAINASYRALDGIARPVQAFEAAVSARAKPVQAAGPVEEAEAPVVEVVNTLVTQALRDRASDIHIEPQGDRIRVRYRIDGALREVLSLPTAMGPAVVSRIKIMAGMNIVERRRPQDGQFTTLVDGQDLDVRVATSATIHGETAVLRLLEKGRSLHKMSQLGMSDAAHARFSRLIRSPFGMVVCAGPTGSGKTTTLYAALAEINTPDRNIITIEDPVEYVVPSINQTQINEAADITFAGGLKAILRQDPDIMLVGEIRDAETARIAVQSALTGHLVLSSLHATDAVSALLRFVHMGIEPFLVAGSVTRGRGAAPRAADLLRLPCALQAARRRARVLQERRGPGQERFWHGEGCNYCSGTGYQDRVGVYELLVLDENVRELVVRQAGAEELRAGSGRVCRRSRTRACVSFVRTSPRSPRSSGRSTPPPRSD